MVNYYDFDYENQKQIEDVLTKIDKEIQFCFQNYIVDIVGGKKEFANPIIIDTTEGYNLTETNPRRKNFSDTYAKNAKKLFSKEYPLPDDWDELGAAEKAMKIRDLVYRLETTEKNKSQKLKNDKIIESVIKENEEHRQDIKSYIMFLLTLRANELEKLDYTPFEDDRQKIINISNKYLARIKNLMEIENIFSGSNAAMLTIRDMQDPMRQTRTKVMIEYDISTAQYLLEQAETPTNKRYKDKKNLMYDMCESYSRLNSDKNVIDEMINITYALITRELNEAYNENQRKVNFIENIKSREENLQNFNTQSIYMFLNKELMQQTSEMFFNDRELLSSTEKLAQLQALRLSTINTMEELKDYLIKNRSEIKMERTNDGKIEITIGRSDEIDSKLSVNGRTETENKYMNSNTSITYIYDPMNKELEGYKLSGQAYMFSKDMNSEIGQKLTNQFNMFLGNLEASTNIPIFTMFNLSIPIPNGTNIEANILKIKDNLKTKIKDNLNLSIDTTVKAGNISIENFSISPSALDLAITPEIETKKYKIKMPSVKESISSIFKEGTTFSDLFATKIATTYFNASMTGLVNDLKLALGKSGEELITFKFDKDSGCLSLIGTDNYLQDKKELLSDINKKIRLSFAVIKKDTSAVGALITANPDLVSDAFSTNDRKSQLFESMKLLYNSLVDVKSTIATIIEGTKDSKDTVHAIRTKDFENLFDNFRKNESVFIINESTLIDDNLIDEKLKFLLTLNLETKDLKKISSLLEKTKTPEKFYENIREAINNNSQEVKNYLQSAYSNVIEDKIKELIKCKKEDEIYKLLKTKKFNKEILSAFKNSKKRDSVFILSNLLEKTKDKDELLGLDEIIKKHQKDIEKFAPNIIKEISR